MSQFLRTDDFLRRDGTRWPFLQTLVCPSLLGAWGWWSCSAVIGVYEASDSSEVQVDQEIHPVQVETSGRISNSLLVLGKHVQAGELLLELDDSEARLELSEARVRLAGIGPQLDRLDREITSQYAALQYENDELAASQREAESVSKQALTRASMAREEAALDHQLYSAGTLSRFDMERADSRAREGADAAESARESVSRVTKQQRRRRQEALAGIQGLEKQAAELKADQQTARAQIERLEHEIQRRRIYAPISGTVAEIEPVKPAMVVQAGQRVATILPSGTLKVVAQFAPSAVTGRINPGQPARLLADRFPWSQFGAVPLTVETVGIDPENGRIRVELVVNSGFHSRIPMQHGLRGTTEVLVDRATPLTIVVRAAGRHVSTLSDSPDSSMISTH